MVADNPLLLAAMRLAIDPGWSVFPCRPSGKVPLIGNGFKGATRNEATLFEWWRKWPDANLGVPTGAVNGIWVLDVDVKNGRDGEATLVALEAAHHELPETVMARTRSGGTHLFFAHPGGLIGNSAGRRPGLDVRGDGGYVIVAPSVVGGVAYRWILSPDEVPPADGGWLLDLLAERPPEQKPPPTPRPRSPGHLTPYAKAALDSAVRRIAGAPAGQQHDTLNREAFTIGALVAGGAMPAPLALELLTWAARQMPTFDARRPWRPAELDRQIRDAFVAGQLHPREIPNG